MMKLIAVCLSCCALHAAPTYPEAPKSNHIDDYNGVLVADPYRWMEDLNAAPLKKWVAEEKVLADSYFDETPLKEEMLARLKEIDSYENISLPIVKGHRWFLMKRTSLFNGEVLVRDDFLPAPRRLIDSSEFSEDGSVEFTNFFPSHDGKWVAYFLQNGGSDWCTARIRSVETGRDLEDRIEWIKFSDIVWDPKNEGFFYGRFSAPPTGEELTALNDIYKLYYHKMGTSQQDDILIYENSEEIHCSPYLHSVVEQRYLGIRLFDARNWSTIGYLYKDLSDPNSSVQKVFEDPLASYAFMGKVGEEIFFLTNKEAPRSFVVAIRPNQAIRTVIPETSAVLESAFVIGDRIVCQYLRNGCPEIYVFSLEGRLLFEIALPKKICCIEQIKPYPERREVWLKISSPESPPESYYVDLEKRVLEPIFRPTCSWVDDDFETEQVFYKAKDGTPLILFISHKKGIALDGKNPTILYGYGRFGVNTHPNFLAAHRVWLEKGGIYCIAAIRGGGEYGRDPSVPGAQVTQQSVDDFLSAAEWLIEHSYTSKEHLGILGSSNGGWLVATCMNQRPDLFRAVVIGSGLLDLLRAPQYTIGWKWSSYGKCWDEKMFSLNYPLSPYHNVEKGVCYPATLFIVGNRDDRVVPSHSYKHLAHLQEAQGGNAPLLLHLQENQGHYWIYGGNSFEPWARTLAFFYREMFTNQN